MGTEYDKFLKPFGAMTKKLIKRRATVCNHLPREMAADISAEMRKMPIGFIPLQATDRSSKGLRYEIIYVWKRRAKAGDLSGRARRVLPIANLREYSGLGGIGLRSS